MTRVKICGVREVEHALAAVEAGADLLGFIFYPAARRYLAPSAAGQIASALPRGSVELVGVFVNAPAAEIEEIAGIVGLDRIQLSGDEPIELNATLRLPVARTVHVEPTTTFADVAARAAGADLIHLDARRPGAYGGTGTTFDWRLAGEAAALGPVLMAGGLNPENVAEAIAAAAPWGVDVSSGVELEGRKDSACIHAFVAAARAAAALSSPIR